MNNGDVSIKNDYRLFKRVCRHFPNISVSTEQILMKSLRIFKKSWNFIKMGPEQQVRYMTTYIHLYIATFFFEWEMFQANCEEKSKNIFYIQKLFFTICFLWDNLEKYLRTWYATADNITRQSKVLFACEITRARTQTHIH